MNDHNQKVEPVRFEPAAPPAGEVGGAQPASKSGAAAAGNWVLPTLAGLVVLALLVVFWLPGQIDSDSIEVAAAGDAVVRKKPAAADVSPWSDAQLARQRKDAQAVLAELLDEQFALEEMQVGRWAAEDFAAAQASAAQADEQYRQQLYIDAAATYQQALDAMLAISASVDEVFENLLRQGLEALLSDQAAAAVAALELALILRPDSVEAGQALQRAHKLAPLLALLEQAGSARENGQLEQALELLQRAHQLDPQHAGAEAQLRSAERDIARRDFNRAMTAGYAALDEQRYDEAERQFRKAQRIRPASAETESALEQTRTDRTSAQIEAFRQRAAAAEEREAWEQAATAYKEILDIDDTVVFARAGLIRSQTRARLDTRLRGALEKPERLSDDKVYANTRALYKQALGIEKKGHILREQLTRLDQLLQQARVPVPVLLRSDEQTDVTVYKVAHLGTFSRQQLNLKPGVYTAVGVRNGYRDVRLEFKVAHDQETAVIDISCTEPI